MRTLISLFFLFFPKKKFSRDRLVGEILAVVFVIFLCWLLNQYPNSSLYCKVSTEDAVITMIIALVWAQVGRIVGLKIHRSHRFSDL